MAECVSCNLCGEPGTLSGASDVGKVPCNVERFRDQTFTFWRCTGCGSLHCAEDADLPFYYADYPLKYHKTDFFIKIGYANRLKRLRRAGLKDTDRVLDYGCGAGLFVDFLREKGIPAFGYDAFDKRYSDPGALTESYDAVVSYDVIEHDDDPRAWMRRVARLVRPGGLLAIGTPNADGASLSRTRDPLLHPPYHRHLLSERVLLALGNEQGMTAIDVYRRSFFDTLVPTVNHRFMWAYIEETGGMIDAAVRPPQTGLVLRSPKLLWLAFFGYFLSFHDDLLVTFRR